MWPWRRKPVHPDPPVRRRHPGQDQWRKLEPFQRVFAEPMLVNPVQRFSSGLAAWQDPRFLAPLEHVVSADEPSGVISLTEGPSAGTWRDDDPYLPLASAATSSRPTSRAPMARPASISGPEPMATPTTTQPIEATSIPVRSRLPEGFNDPAAASPSGRSASSDSPSPSRSVAAGSASLQRLASGSAPPTSASPAPSTVVLSAEAGESARDEGVALPESEAATTPTLGSQPQLHDLPQPTPLVRRLGLGEPIAGDVPLATGLADGTAGGPATSFHRAQVEPTFSDENPVAQRLIEPVFSGYQDPALPVVRVAPSRPAPQPFTVARLIGQRPSELIAPARATTLTRTTGIRDSSPPLPVTPAPPSTAPRMVLSRTIAQDGPISHSPGELYATFQRHETAATPQIDATASVPSTAAAAPMVQRISETPTGTASSGGTLSTGAPAVAGGEPEELLAKLYDPLLRRLKAELRVDRDRRGWLTDLPH
jgi:hypothetical protein